MVVRWNGEETEMPMNSHGRAQAFKALMDYSRVEHVPFDELAKRMGQDRAALCYSFHLVDIIRFLSALQHGVGITEEYPDGKTVDTFWRPDEVRAALEHEFRRPMPVLATRGLE